MNSATIGKVNDISGFFAKYNELNQAHFQSLFGENLTASDIETLDFCLSDLYGARFLQSRFNDVFNNKSANECMTRIVAISDRMFFENWLDTKRAIEKALTTDLENPLTSTRNGENATVNKVNAFDSETAVDSDESSHTYSETKTYSNGKTATQNAKSQIDFSRNNDFLEIIINDVLSVACTSVYDDNYVCERTQGGGGGTDPELENRVEQCETDITDVKNLIPSNASTSNKLATMSDIQGGYDDTEIRNEINEIKSVIPSTADSSNKLTTKSELQAVENSIPDVTGLATKQELQDITDLIPSNASTSNKLATIADIGGGGSSGGDEPWIKKTFSVSGITNGRFSINVLLGSGTDGNGNYYLGYDSTEYSSSDFPEVEVIMWGVNYPIIRQVDTTINGMGGMQLSFLLLDNTGSVSSVTSASGMIVARKRTMAT